MFGLDILNLTEEVIAFQGRLFLFFISISLKYLLNLTLALPSSMHKFLSLPYIPSRLGSLGADIRTHFSRRI